jgi:hypothetical protein
MRCKIDGEGIEYILHGVEKIKLRQIQKDSFSS